MVVDPPGTKYIIGAASPYTRIPDDSFPDKIDVDLDAADGCPDGWLLRTVSIGYNKDGSTYVSIRFGEGDSYAAFEHGDESRILDIDWEEETGLWWAEWALDDFESGFHELDWTELDDGLSFDEALDVAFKFMQKSG